MIWSILWSIILTGVAIIWATRHIVITRARRQQYELSSQSHPGPVADAPKVSVLIAAKDEEENIETAVRSFLAQDYPNFELIVVNDRSEDGTPRILDSLEAEYRDGRLKVVHVGELRDGWFGKNNAMREGMTHASGQWLCFGDADCRQTSNRTLSVAMHHALEEEVDFLSILPRFENHTLWEKIIQPVCGSVMMIRFNPRDVNDPNHSAAYANGAFMLMSRRCYETIGGHEGVRTEVNEDMHLARRTKERGQRLQVVENEDLYSVRMYSSFSGIWRGWSRIFYGCFGTFGRLRFALTMLAGTNGIPYLSALIAWVVLSVRGWDTAGAGWQWVGVTSLLAVALQLSVIARFYRIIRISPWFAPTFVIGAAICSGMLISAMLRLNGRGTTTWRGTTYRADKVMAA
jgi:chlorobactene glucosyltransferase